jgi:D-aminoacyl-tRNA deacylase
VRILVVNRGDNASTNIRDRLLDHDWVDTGSNFRGHPMYQRGYDMMLQVDGPVVMDEELNGDLALREWPISAVWFLSRHRAASGQPSLTVHPIGNHRTGEFGGQDETLSPAASRDMGALLRRLAVHREAFELPHQVTYEATHHGPHMDLPSLFVEIGSNEDWYDDRPSAMALAAAVTDVLDGEGFAPDAPVVVGVGGGHYVPRQTAKALQAELEFGHFLPAYAFDAQGSSDALLRAIAATPGCAGVYVHKKGLKGPQRQAIKAWCEASDIPVF